VFVPGCLQVAEAEAAFLKQVATVATDAAQLKALVDSVVPEDVAKWQLAADIQQLRKDTHGLSRGLRQQKEVSWGIYCLSCTCSSPG
jgi:hypothetical protein